MCLISVLPKGTVKFSKEVESFIRTGMHSQRDGSGLMWKKYGKNTVNIKKGIFNTDELLSFLDNLSLEKEDELAIHHRTGTQGNNDGPNTHPFLITADASLCTSLQGEFNLPALMQNGIFKKVSRFDKDGLSDTFSFTNGLLNSKPYILEMLKQDPDMFLKAFAEEISWSRMCIMFPDRETLITGSFIKDSGYYHSNACYYDYSKTDRGGVSDSSKTTGKSSKKFIIDSDSNLVLDEEPDFEEPDFDDIESSHYMIGHNVVINKSTSKVAELVKLSDIHIDIDVTNYTNFVYTLKDKHKVYGIESVKAYRATNWNDKTNLVALYTTDDVSNRIVIKTSELCSMFYYLPIKEFKTIFNDYVLLNRALKPSKTMIKKLQKQVSSKFNKSELEKIRIKSINTFVAKASIELFIKKHSDLLVKPNKKIAVPFSISEDEVNKAKQVFDQEQREFTFSE